MSCPCDKCTKRNTPKCDKEQLKADAYYLHLLLAKAEERKKPKPTS